MDLYNKKMAEYAQDFQTQSQGLMSYIQGKLSSVVSWTPLPGGLNKIVTSSAGYVWGFNLNGGVYICKEPCDGHNWRAVDGPPKMSGMPLDIAVDDQNVYILYNSKAPETATSAGYLSGPLIGGRIPIQQVSTDDQGNPVYISFEAPYTKLVNSNGVSKYYTGPTSSYSPANWTSYTNTIVPQGYKATVTQESSPGGPTNILSFSIQRIDGSGSWSEPQKIPGTPPANPTIHLTDQFVFVGTQGCSKPCTTGSWVAINQPSGGQGIVAASSGNTYALGANNTIYQSSGNGQGGWTEQGGLSGVMPLAVGADSQFIIGVDQSSHRPVRCSPPYTGDDSCHPDNTFTNRPMAGSHTVSVNPRSYQTYVAAASSGTYGNLYQRVDPGSIDHSGALEDTRQYLSQMDSDVNALGTATSTQDAQIQVGKVKQAANTVIKKISDIREERENTAAERDRIKRKIQTLGAPSSDYKMKILQTITITLALVLLSYFVLGLVLPPFANMSIAIVGMLVGLGFAISFAVSKQ